MDERILFIQGMCQVTIEFLPAKNCWRLALCSPMKLEYFASLFLHIVSLFKCEVINSNLQCIGPPYLW